MTKWCRRKAVRDARRKVIEAGVEHINNDNPADQPRTQSNVDQANAAYREAQNKKGRRNK